MHKDKYVFAQLVGSLDRSKFNRIVAKYQGDKYVKHFTCWNHLLVLRLCQLCDLRFNLDISTYKMQPKTKLYSYQEGSVEKIFTKPKTSNIKDLYANKGQILKS